MAALCGRLERMLVGRHAQQWLDGVHGPLPRGNVVVAVLPSWYWAKPVIDVGRKAKPRQGGGSLVMPVRVHWTDGPVVQVLGPADIAVLAQWRASGLGTEAEGCVTVTAAPLGAAEEVLPTVLRAVPERLAVARQPRAHVVSLLRRLVEDGRAARWEALEEMEPRIRWALERAHVEVSIEIGREPAHDAPALLDGTTLEGLADVMLLGEADSGSAGFADRLLEHCLSKPTLFARVDPLKYVTTRTRVEANLAVRRKLGDPHVGRKVRAVMREVGDTDLDRLLDVYRERHPKDLIAKPRLQAALTVAPSPMVGYYSLSNQATVTP